MCILLPAVSLSWQEEVDPDVVRVVICSGMPGHRVVSRNTTCGIRSNRLLLVIFAAGDLASVMD
jgi:hypothetical protein